MLAAIEYLYEIQNRCAQHSPLSADQQALLASALERFLANRCANLNEAFGVIQSHGGVPWWREQAIRNRDAALRELGERHLADRTVYARAKNITKLANRYAATAWRHDRERAAMPAHYAGDLREQLWKAFKSGAAMPLSERRLRSLLA